MLAVSGCSQCLGTNLNLFRAQFTQCSKVRKRHNNTLAYFVEAIVCVIALEDDVICFSHDPGRIERIKKISKHVFAIYTIGKSELREL